MRWFFTLSLEYLRVTFLHNIDIFDWKWFLFHNTQIALVIYLANSLVDRGWRTTKWTNFVGSLQFIVPTHLLIMARVFESPGQLSRRFSLILFYDLKELGALCLSSFFNSLLASSWHAPFDLWRSQKTLSTSRKASLLQFKHFNFNS